VIDVGELSVYQHRHVRVSIQLTFGKLLKIRILPSIIDEFNRLIIGSI
jgi:hypothetical protein